MIENEIFRSLLPLLIANSLVILPLIPFAFIYRKRPRDPEILDRMHKTFLGIFVREYWYWLTSPFISFFQLIKLTPNKVTGISLVFALVAGYYFYKGNFALAAWMICISSTLDVLDGRLARATNRVTHEGAFFDSCVDRYADGFIFMGLALYFRNDFYMLLASLFALVGSEVISYARAKGEIIGVSTKRGLMQRAERIVLLSLVSVFHPFFMVILSKYGIKTEYPMIIVIILLAILTNYTAAVRIFALFNKIRSLDQKDG